MARTKACATAIGCLLMRPEYASAHPWGRFLAAPPKPVPWAKVSLAAAKEVRTPLQPGLCRPAELRDYLQPGGAGRDLVRLPLGFPRLNQDALLRAAPAELFREIAVDIGNRSPFLHTFFGYTNGLMGYLPTRRAFVEGGYELTVTSFTGRVEEDLVSAVVSFLDESRR